MDIFNYSPRTSHVVHVGQSTLGGESPLRLQSMTTTATADVAGSVAQSKRIFDAGADYVRLTAQGLREVEALRDIRRHQNPVGVIIVSAKGSLDDKVKGLEIGADDYLPKPFHLAELSMRIYAIIRRKEFMANNTLCSNGIEINLPGRSVHVHGKPVVLTRTEYELLLFFIGNRNKVISKASIAEHLSGDMADLLDNHDFIYTHIKNLKAKLMKAGIKDCIKNVYGTGYKWIEQ